MSLSSSAEMPSLSPPPPPPPPSPGSPPPDALGLGDLSDESAPGARRDGPSAGAAGARTPVSNNRTPPDADALETPRSVRRSPRLNNPVLRAHQEMLASRAARGGGDIAQANRPPGDTPGGEVTLSAVNDPACFMPHEDFFMWLQDTGTPMTAADKAKYNDDPKKSHYTKAKNHRHGDFFYPLLFKLTSALYNLMKANQSVHFPKLPANKHPAQRLIFSSVLNLRFSRNMTILASGMSANDGIDSFQFELAERNMDELGDNIYFLPQRSLVQEMSTTFGATMDYLKIPTSDDRLRVVFIMMDEEMRAGIPYFLQERDINDRMSLDEWNGKKRLYTHLLYNRFICLDTSVPFPAAWNTEETRTVINERVEDGFFQSLSFNPANPSRVAVPWTKEDVLSMFKTTLKEYGEVMVEYTKGTGGGEGRPAAFAVWQDREPEDIVSYISSNSQATFKKKVYLTPVHMYDKQFSWILTPGKGEIPDGVGLDDDDNHAASASASVASSAGTTRHMRNSVQALASGIQQRNDQSVSFQQGMARSMEKIADALSGDVDSGGVSESLLDRQHKLQVGLDPWSTDPS